MGNVYFSFFSRKERKVPKERKANPTDFIRRGKNVFFYARPRGVFFSVFFLRTGGCTSLSFRERKEKYQEKGKRDPTDFIRRGKGFIEFPCRAILLQNFLRNISLLTPLGKARPLSSPSTSLPKEGEGGPPRLPQCGVGVEGVFARLLNGGQSASDAQTQASP